MWGRFFKGGLLGWAPALTLGVFLLPIAAGLAATALPAFGYHPAIGRESFSLAPFAQFFSLPGVRASTILTVRAGLLGAVLSFGLAMFVCASLSHTRFFKYAQGVVSPLLATPHSATAIGLAFLLAPSGWIFRILSSPLGLQRPPNIITLQDSWGLSFALGVTLKAAPYLVLMTIAAAGQVRQESTLTAARAMGYGPTAAWFKTVFPRIYPQIRLPVYAVLAFSLSVVDMALILAPNTPPPLAVYVLRLFNHKELAMQLPGAAGALSLFFLVLSAILLWRVGEVLVMAFLRPWLGSGKRGISEKSGRRLGVSAVCVVLLTSGASVAVLALWSVAKWWRFPAAAPQQFTLGTWARHLDSAISPMQTTLFAGVFAVVIALALVLACLENEDRRGVKGGSRSLLLLYTPLLVPQIAFLFGVQVLFIRMNIVGEWPGLIWGHLLFVLPYVFLSLADPWRSLDERYARSAACLGASPRRIFFRIKLPMLVKPIFVAGAIGFSVSAAEYLPTLLVGAGRFTTLTTEAVTLAAGADRRTAAVYAFLQAMLPLAVYSLAIVIPAYLSKAGKHPGK